MTLLDDTICGLLQLAGLGALKAPVPALTWDHPIDPDNLNAPVNIAEKELLDGR